MECMSHTTPQLGYSEEDCMGAWEGDVPPPGKKVRKLRTFYMPNINFNANLIRLPYEHKVCTVFIKQFP